MTSKQPLPSSSRRPKDPIRPEMAVGSFRRLEEVGRGSFATVYKGSMSVSEAYMYYLVPSSLSMLLRVFETFINDSASCCCQQFTMEPPMMLTPLFTEETWLRCYQVCRSQQTQQEVKGKPILRDPYPQRSPSSTHRRSHRLPRNHCSYPPYHGAMRAR